MSELLQHATCIPTRLKEPLTGTIAPRETKNNGTVRNEIQLAHEQLIKTQLATRVVHCMYYLTAPGGRISS